MVEKQELSKRQKILNKHSSFTGEILNEGRGLHEEIITVTEYRFARFKSLKTEIDDDMARAHEVLDRVRKKILENILSDENKDGLLTGKHDDYLKCLEMN